MSQANFDLRVFQGKKFIEGIYTYESSMYKVVESGLSAHNRGVAVLYCSEEHFSLEQL